jgi:hypothetical protein
LWIGDGARAVWNNSWDIGGIEILIFMDVITGDDSRREEKGGYAMRVGASGTTTFRYLMVFPAF